MTSRYGRSGSPTGPGRRYQDPARSSTGSVYSTYDPPSSYKHRDSFTSPRTSGERVVPISSETYINGQRLNTGAASRPSYDAYDSRPRRSTYDEPPRAPYSSGTSSYLQPAVVHHSTNRGTSTGTRTSNYDPDRYVSSSIAPKREHKKVYTVDDGKNTRLVQNAEKDTSRTESTDTRRPAPPPDRSRRDYHLSGPSRRTAAGDEDGGYEYTDARGMYRDTEPKWRTRRGSFDSVGRERPSSMIEPYSNSRSTAREPGPLPATRGFEKINTNLGRHGSVTGSIASPTRQHDRGYGSISSGYSEDENYRVAPRILLAERTEAGYKLPSHRGEVYSPTREDFGGRRESRAVNRRFEDADITSRGFGIRAPSVEPRRSRDESIGRHGGYDADTSARPLPRDYPRERDLKRNDTRLEPDRRAREEDREVLLSKKTSPPQRTKDHPYIRNPPRDVACSDDPIYPRDVLPSKERSSGEDLPYNHAGSRSRNVPPERARATQFEESLGDRERELPLRNKAQKDSLDDERLMYDKGSERDLRGDREPLDMRSDGEVERVRPSRDSHHDYVESVISHGSSAASTDLTSAALNSAALGTKQARDQRQARILADEDRMDRPKAGDQDPGELDPTVTDMREGRRDGHIDGHHDGSDRSRRRHYIAKDNFDDAARLPESLPKQSDMLDPEEDYRRRVQQESLGVFSSRQAQDPEDIRRSHRRETNLEPIDDSTETIGRGSKERQCESDNGSESDHSRGSKDAQALTKCTSLDYQGSDGPRFTDEPTEIPPRKNRVSIVEPPREVKNPKGILRKPTEKFPEDPNPVREGVAPLKDGKSKDVPAGARWTKINRSMVNPEALEEAQERFEERQEHVIVLRVLTREEIQKFADRTKEIRDSRYDRDHKDRRSRRDGRHEHESAEDSRDEDEGRMGERK